MSYKNLFAKKTPWVLSGVLVLSIFAAACQSGAATNKTTSEPTPAGMPYKPTPTPEGFTGPTPSG